MIVKSVIVNDRVSYAIESRRVYADNGYLIVPGRVARVGVQQYLACELQLADRDPNEIINVYRPPEEVFNPKSLNSYDGVDITIEHPGQLVNSETFEKVSKGTIRGSGVQVDDFVECELIVKSNDAISSVNSGKVQLSAGYSAVYDHTPGFVAPDGTVCEFTQRNIIINHVALVDRARAGASARIFDNETGNINMSKVTIDSGKSVDITDAAVATLFQDTIDRLMKRVNDAESESEEAEKALAKAEKAIEELEEKVEELEESVGDSAIQKRVDQIVKLKDSAKRIAGRKFSSDSLSPMEIMKAALKAARPKVAWDSKNEAYIQAAFDAEEERKAENDEEENIEEEDEMTEEERRENSDSAIRRQRAQLAADGARGILPKGKKSGHQTYTDSLRSSWKNTIGGNK